MTKDTIFNQDIDSTFPPNTVFLEFGSHEEIVLYSLLCVLADWMVNSD